MKRTRGICVTWEEKNWHTGRWVSAYAVCDDRAYAESFVAELRRAPDIDVRDVRSYRLFRGDSEVRL